MDSLNISRPGSEMSSTPANHRHEDAEIVLFSRPLNMMPTNPFATIDKMSNFSESISPGNFSDGTKENGDHKNFVTEISDEGESDIEFEKGRGSKLSSHQTVYAPTTVPTINVNSARPQYNIPGNSKEQAFYFDPHLHSESDDDEPLDIKKISASMRVMTPATPSGINQSSSKQSSNETSKDHFNNISSQNSTGVRIEDVIFSSIIFISHLLSFVVDFSLMCWYYWDEGSSYNFKWCSALTFLILIVGSIGILHRFNQAEKDRLDRLFIHGRRVQLLVNSFPPLGTILCSYYCVRSAWKAKTEQVFSVHFFAIEEFSQNLSRVQGFFQSAPQAVLQLLILMETMNEITMGKGFLTFLSVALSLTVMTIANLPGRSDMVQTSIRKGVYSPVSRLFLGVRMISSFGSRTMSVAYFFMGLRCLYGTHSTALSIVSGISAIIIPRLIFTFVDYCHHLHLVRRGRVAVGGQFGRLSCCGTCTGYLATILFPMSHPLWVFWFIWTETVVFMAWGFITIVSSNAASSSACLSHLVNFTYTGVFTLLFFVIPFLLPYARAKVKQKRSKQVAKLFEERDRDVTNLQQHVTDSV